MAEASEVLVEALRRLPIGAIVVDMGCLHWKLWHLAQAIQRRDLMHIGIDLHDRNDTPPGCRFCRITPELGSIAAVKSYAPAGVDLLVASHVIEHLSNPVEMFGSWVDITRVHGLIYVEAPSEISARLPSDDDVESHGFGNFWDDPTHVRPWPPAALYRLGLSWGTRPEQCSRLERGGIPSSMGLFRRLEAGPPTYGYLSLETVPPGIDAAMKYCRQIR